MSDLIGIYNQLVIALRGDDDEAAHAFFHPDFQVHEDPGMPYGGTFQGADGFIALRRKVRTYWQLEILSKCVAPEGDRLVIVLRLTGQPEGPVAQWFGLSGTGRRLKRRFCISIRRHSPAPFPPHSRNSIIAAGG